MKKYLFIFFIVILYGQGLLLSLGFSQLTIDFALFSLPVLIIATTKGKLKLAPGFKIVGLFIIWSIISALYNNEGFLRPLLFSRYLILGYLVLWSIWNTYFDIKQVETINKIIFIMFFIQIVASLPEIIQNNIKENTVGIMFIGGGGIATTFPLFALAFMFSFYIYRKNVIYLILGFLFLIVGYASGKLGIYVLFPIVLTIGTFLYLKIEKIPYFNKELLKFSFGFLFFLLIFLTLLPFADPRTKRLDLKNSNSIERLSSFINFSEEQEQNSFDKRYTTSRSGTSLRVIEETFRRPIETFLFGNGFKAYQDIDHSNSGGAFEEYGIIYGITGWTYDAITYGWPIVFIHLSFYYFYFRKLRERIINKISDSYLRILNFSLLLNFYVFLFNYFFYNNQFTVGGWIICIYMYFTGIVLSPNYINTLNFELKSKNNL
jgi:hypothetical protein